jgi:hypothetical protein
MSAPFAVIVRHGPRETIDVFGPFDEDEADAFAAKLRNVYELDASVELLRGFTDDDVARLQR